MDRLPVSVVSTKGETDCLAQLSQLVYFGLTHASGLVEGC
jgi:hypothetical protein